MDTKSKKYSAWFKALAFVVIACASVCFTLQLRTLAETGYDYYEWSYTQTDTYQQMYLSVDWTVNKIIQHKGEAYILDGKSTSDADVEQGINSLFTEVQLLIENRMKNEGYTEITQKMLWDRFQTDYAAAISNTRTSMIEQKHAEFLYAVHILENTPHLAYYIDTGVSVIASPGYSYTSTPGKYGNHYTYSEWHTQIYQYAYAFDEAYIDGLAAEYTAQQYAEKKAMNTAFILGAISLLLFLVSLAYLIFAAGKTSGNHKKVNGLKIDALWNEVTAGLLILCGIAVFWCASPILNTMVSIGFMAVMLILLSASVLLGIAFILMLTRHIKRRTVFKQTLCYTLFKQAKKAFDLGPPMFKALALVTAAMLVVVVPFLFLVMDYVNIGIYVIALLLLLITVPLAWVFTYKQVKKFMTVKSGVKRIKYGDYQAITVEGDGEMAKLAADVNEISAGLSAEVDRRLKSERLKTELIVNVSHDIKTPLTSVITYIDLLKKGDATDGEAKEYIDILARKSDRLKILIDDLFDASKAASGNIPVNLANVDLNALISQGLGESDDKIQASGLDFVVKLQKEKLTVRADGKLLWRAFDNLLSNAVKYSLSGSRVYIDVTAAEQDALITVKNVSATALNIPADELTERFKRGDESRSTDGSGLGLDIAKSLMLCQNGELILKIDGDLFKATLRIPRER